MQYHPTSNHVFNRQSVQKAIRSVQQRLKLYGTGSSAPPTGLAVFCGLTKPDNSSNQSERLVLVDIVPLRPISSLVYRCDNSFHPEYLDGLLFEGNTDDQHGFVIIDGHGALFGRVHNGGSSKKVLRQISVDLPNKHRKGGQSALRFARLRDQARQRFVQKVSELCVELFIATSPQPNIKGLVVAGSADLKDDLIKTVDKRLADIVACSIDLATGGRRGFDEAIQKSAQALGNMRLVQQTKILTKFFDQVSKDLELCCFGVKDTLEKLEMGAVEDLIVWEDLEETRNRVVPEESETHLGNHTLVEWLCDHHKEYGCRLHLINDCSTLGSQFSRGFGGIGGLLRFKLPTTNIHHQLDGSESEDSHNDRVRVNKEEDYLEDGDYAF